MAARRAGHIIIRRHTYEISFMSLNLCESHLENCVFPSKTLEIVALNDELPRPRPFTVHWTIAIKFPLATTKVSVLFFQLNQFVDHWIIME